MSHPRSVGSTARRCAATALLVQLVACGTHEGSPSADSGISPSVPPNPSVPLNSTHSEPSLTATSQVPATTSHGATGTREQTSSAGGASFLDTASSGKPDGSATVAPATDTSNSSEASGDAGAETPSETVSDAAVDSSSSPSNTTNTTSTTAPPAGCDARVDERTLIGYGRQTTGGGAATPLVVNTFAEAVAALDDYRDAWKNGTQTQLVLRYTGTYDYDSITDVCAQHTKDSQIVYIKEVENVTFEGAPGSSANFGIKVNRAKNVIVRNMTMGLLPGGGDSDAITIEGNGNNGDVEHVWIDHNDLFSSTKDDCDGAGDTEFDGLIDIKKGARYITISYNKLHDHQKTGLLGSSDSDDVDRFVTFHHNWYENVVSRTPLHRFGYVHLFNNYFSRISDSGINVRMGGVALIEANYFENAANPVTSRYSDEVGFWDLRDNHVGENVTWTLTEDTLANADDWKSTATFPASQLTYEYEADTAECVKNIVSARAGATLMQ